MAESKSPKPERREPEPAVRDAEPAGRDAEPPAPDADPAGRDAEPAGRDAEPAGREPAPQPVPTRLVVVAYVIALLCAIAPLAVLGAGFAGAVLLTHGRRGAGAGVVAVAVLCAALGILLR